MAGFTGIGNVNPITAAILTQPLQAVALKPGQFLQGIVQSLEPQTIIRFGNIVVPVERIEGIQAGQAVSAEVVRSGDGLQLRIMPGSTPTTHDPPQSLQTQTGARALPGFIVDALRTLGKLELADHAVHLIPARIAHNAVAVRLVLTILLDRGEHGEDAERLIQLLQQAADDGALAPEELPAALKVLRSLAASKDLIDGVNQRGLAMSRAPLAARLAEAIAHGEMQAVLESLHEDSVTALLRLRDNASLNEFLRQTGQHADFSRAIERLAERFVASQLVNARSTDVPYLFFELPMRPDSPISNAHIHIMGDGGGKAGRFDAKNATIVLDLSTSALGDLWITITVASGACSCWLRAQEINTVTALQRHSAGLVGHLAEAGYPNVAVHATLWDGNRVQELATLMRRFNGINLQA
ncbi:MAG: hypothetical protein SGI88_00075 [Candidatus Hydrogenedentes bacterium]|nr:hypothetical protein [Candidatus Hydrogenedentota bacterium]